MWKLCLITAFVVILTTNSVQATYNSGIKTRTYEVQPITTSQVYHQHSTQYVPTNGHYEYNRNDHTNNNENDYQTSITHHYSSGSSSGAGDNTYRQQQQQHHHHQQHEGNQYYQPQQQQQPQQHYHHHHQHNHQQQQHYTQQQPQLQQPQPIYDRRDSSRVVQSSRNVQNSENSINEYYTGCPSGHTGQLPYAYDCRRFLNCWHGRGHIQSCSVGTVFNPETLECDRPDKVKCEAALGVLGIQSAGKQQQQHSSTHGQLKQPQQPNYRAGRYTDTQTDNVDILCPTNAQGLQPHPSDCTKFINCANGNVHIQQCGPGTAFSVSMKVCDFKDKVDCSGRETGAVQTTSSNRQVNNDEVSCAPGASGLYFHPFDCTKFLNCAHGETYIQDCGPGTGFDSVRLICDYKEKVKCGSGSAWGSTESTVTTQHFNAHETSSTSTSSSSSHHSDLPHTADILCLNGITGLFPYPFDYTKFINCKNGNTAIQNCVPGTAFSLSKGYCESLDDIVKSDHVMYIVSQVNYEYSQTLITCPPGTEGIHLYPFNAEKFVKCIKSQMTIVPCPPNQVLSIARRTCLPLGQVLKYERVLLLSELQKSNSYRVTEEQYNIHNMVYCPGGISGTYPHPFDSTKYLKCVNGRLFSESCASGEAFSLSRKVCNLKEEINANDRVPLSKLQNGQEWSEMETTYGGTDGLTYLMCPPGLDGYFLHPFDCTKYLQCSHGSTEVDSCLNGAVFSISRKECIPRDKVEAYDRVEYMITTTNEFSNDAVNLHQDLGVSCSPGTFGIYAHPDDCHKFVRCANGRISVENCPPGEVFSLTRSFCHAENEVENRDRSSYTRSHTVTQTHQTGPQTTSTNTVYNTGSYQPAIPSTSLNPPYNTGSYYPMNQPDSTNLPSTDINPPLTPVLMPPHTNGVTCAPGVSGRYPHPYDCTKFLMCSNGVAHEQDCGPGTAWNKEMEVCDFKDKVGCNDSGTSTVTSSSTSNTNSFGNTENQILCPVGIEGLYEHPYDWHKYLSCSQGQTFIMDCGPGTVFSVSHKICDLEANVVNTDRCNNGVYSTEYDYTYNQIYNNRDSKAYSGSVNTQWSQNQPATQTQTTQQVTGNRWTNMNVPRPQGNTYDQSSTWQQTTNTQHTNSPARPEPSTPVWSGTAVHVDRQAPTHTVIYEEGSFEPNRNYNRPMFNTPITPLAPLAPLPATTSTSTTSTIVYAQPVGSQEDSQETFSNIPKPQYPQYYPAPNPNLNRQNHTRNINTNPWTPIRPIDTPRHNLMPPVQQDRTVYTNTHTQVPITTHLMPPAQEPFGVYGQEPPRYPYPPNDERPKQNFDQQNFQPNVHNPNTHLTHPYEDRGQQPEQENDFKITNINVDELPGQKVLTFNDLDQLSSGSTKINTVDESNLYGGLQPPLPGSQMITNPNSFLEQTTQIPPPPEATTPIATRESGYPHLSNATIQTFPRQPHYSPPYAEVAHSSGRKTPLYASIKPNYGHQTILDNVDLTTTPPPRFYSHNSPHSPTYAITELGEEEPDQETMKEALKLLLRPYLDSSTSVDENAADKAQSHIMSLVSSPDREIISTTTTIRPTPSNVNTIASSSTTPSQQHDVELILAGEQHNLVGYANTKTGKHETSTAYNLRQAPLETDLPNNHNTNWHKHHQLAPHHSKVHHSREYHEKHPNLPNPFDVPYNPLAESTTPVTGDFDLRTGGQCPFDCGNGKCVEQHQVCDGVNNCGNRKDEQQCENLGYEVRLTGGQSSHMGRVEVKILGKWGYVCDDKFGLPDADVLCRELGFKMGAMEIRGSSFYPPTDINVSFAMDEVECKGNETSLRDCDFKGWGVNNCGPDEVVGVVCKVPKLKCPDNYWLCTTSKECIPTAFLCDVTPDCEDGTDESEQVCNAPIKYRLEGGRSQNEGRLEVFYRGEWGTVCDDDFTLKEAQVVCNSFGLYGKPELVKNIFGPGSGPIWLDQVSCLGNETKIDECNHWSWGENNCNHTEDVGLKCTAGPKPNPARTNKAIAASSGNKANEFRSSTESEQAELDDLGKYQGLWQRSSKAVQTQKQCGHFKSNLFDEYDHPEERVINGSIAKRGRHPWQATIRTRGRGGISSHWCGAVIISKKLILTAAHCLAGYPKGSYFVRMGDHYANIAESSEVDSNIENWYIHEKFRDQKHMNNDIALILLKNPVHFNDYVQPICLPEKGSNLESNRMCTISGWGSIKSGTSTPSNILRSAQVPILADEVCHQKNVYANAMTEGMFCAGFLDESVDACDGDSGGPLVCSDDDGETLYGIISWGQHCGFANHPGVYVRVEKYIDWIYDKINLMMQQGKL